MHIRSLISAAVVPLLFLIIGAETARAAGTPAGTVIQTRSRAVYTTAAGTATDTVYSAYVAFTVRQIGTFNVTPIEDGRSSASDSTAVDYPVTVTNSGNGTDVGTFTAVSSRGWSVTLFRDVNGDGILQPAELSAGPVSQTNSLTADASDRFILRVAVPRTEVLDGSKDTTMLTVRSQFDTAKTATGRSITTVRSADLRSVLSGLTADDPSPTAGSMVTYTLSITNNGSIAASAVKVSDLLPSGVTLVDGTASQGTFNSSVSPVLWTIGTIAPGQAVTVELSVSVQVGLAAGTVISNGMAVGYTVASNQYSLGSNVVAVTVDPPPPPPPFYGVSLKRLTAERVHEPADTAVYAFRVKNSGSIKDVMELSLTSSRPLSWVLYRDGNSNGTYDPADVVLSNTNGAGGTDVDSLAVGDSLLIFSVASVPRAYADLVRDTLVVNAVCAAEPLADTSVSTVTTFIEPVVVLSKSALPAGSQPAGAVVTYTITYSNTGSAAVAAFTVTDVTPASTRYLPNSVKVNGTGVSDNTGALSVTEDPEANTVIAVAVGALNAGASGSVEFKVRIK